MKRFDKLSKIYYIVTYSIVTIVLFFVWLFLIKGISSNVGFSQIMVTLFSIGMLAAMFLNICQIVKLCNEEVGKKMFEIFSVMYYVLFIVMWFSFLIYFDYIIIKDWNDESMAMLLFAFIFYIPGIILIKKVIEKIKYMRHL